MSTNAARWRRSTRSATALRAVLALAALSTGLAGCSSGEPAAAPPAAASSTSTASASAVTPGDAPLTTPPALTPGPPTPPAATSSGPRSSPAGTPGPLEDAEPVPTGKAGVPRGGVLDPGAVKDRGGKGADAVADAVAATFYRHDTRLDTSPADAGRRAAPWLTPAYAAALAAPRPGGGGAAWLELADHDGYTTTAVTTVTESGAPPDTGTAAYRQRQVIVTAHGSAGWTRRPDTHALFIRLTRTDPDAPWKVQAVTVA